MSQPSTILAIETASMIGSVALMHNGQYYEASFNKPHQQAAQLIPLIENLLAQASVSYNDLGGLAVTVGPGSFTGIRIGLAVAQSIRMSLPSLACYCFTTLECLASAAHGQEQTIFATLNAGKGELYHQTFKGSTPISDATLSKPQAVAEFSYDYLIGNGASLLPDHKTYPVKNPKTPSATAMLRAIEAGYTPKERAMIPLYIRKPDAEISSKPLL